MPKAFIPAITGAQSTAIAQALRAAGWHVEGHSRRSDAAATDAPGNALAEADALVLTIPQDHRPGAMTSFVDQWVDLAQRHAVGRIVLNMGGTPGPAEEHSFFADLHASRSRVMFSGLAFVVLQPTVYLDNLAAPWAVQALASGTIAYPAGQQAVISWMSHRALGDWVVAVAGGAADGRILSIGGPQGLSGDDLAREIGKGLGRNLTYAPIPLAAFAEGMNTAMGKPAGDRLAAIYARLQQHPDSMHVAPAEAERLGIRSESACDFAVRVLKPLQAGAGD